MNVATQIRNLSQKIPSNHLGLIEGIYRPDLLPAYPSQSTIGTSTLSTLPQDNIVTDETVNEDQALEAEKLHSIADDDIIEQPQAPDESSAGSEAPRFAAQYLVPQTVNPLAQYEKDVKVAYAPLDYAEGYPTLNGLPFWYQMPFEPADAFFCFQIYLRQGNKGARQVFMILEDAEMQKLPAEARPTPQELEETFHTYYWGQRAKAHDMFYAAHRRKELERRALDLNDAHYARASKLLGVFDEYLEVQGPELVETMTPKAAMEMFKTAVQVQRMATGLNANGGSDTNAAPAGASLEVIMRSISRESTGDIIEENPSKLEENALIQAEKREKLTNILKDPAMLERAQELIIKLNTGQPQGAF